MRSRGDPEEAAGMLIRVWIHSTQPLAGTAATEEAEPLRFDGWLELLRVVSELVAAAMPSGAGDGETADNTRVSNETGRFDGD